MIPKSIKLLLSALTDNKRMEHIHINLIKTESASLNTSIFQAIHAALRIYGEKKYTSAPRNN